MKKDLKDQYNDLFSAVSDASERTDTSEGKLVELLTYVIEKYEAEENENDVMSEQVKDFLLG